jgi:hypothetical protein
VIAFRASFETRSPLDELVRERSRQMLSSAIEAEVALNAAVESIEVIGGQPKE